MLAARREGRSCQVPPLPSFLLRTSSLPLSPQTCREDRSSRPHQGARRSRRACSTSMLSHALASKGDRRDIQIVGGRYGLGSKDTTPQQSSLPYTRTSHPDEPKNGFTIGIVDDVTGHSLPEQQPAPDTAAHGTISLQVLGSRRRRYTSAPTRTPSRSSATTPISTFRLTSSTTQRRPAA